MEFADSAEGVVEGSTSSRPTAPKGRRARKIFGAGMFLALVTTNVVHQFVAPMPATLSNSDITIVLLCAVMARPVVAIGKLIRPDSSNSSDSEGCGIPIVIQVGSTASQPKYWHVVLIGMATAVVVIGALVAEIELFGHQQGAAFVCGAISCAAYVIEYHYLAFKFPHPRVSETAIGDMVIRSLGRLAQIREIPTSGVPDAVLRGGDDGDNSLSHFGEGSPLGTTGIDPSETQPKPLRASPAPGATLLAMVGFAAFLVVFFTPASAATYAPKHHQNDPASGKKSQAAISSGSQSGSTNQHQMQSTAPTESTSSPTADEWCGRDPLTTMEALLTTNEALAATRLIEGLGVDNTGCPEAAPSLLGQFTVLNLSGASSAEPFSVVIGPDQRVTAVEGDADADIQAHLTDTGLKSVTGMYSNAPITDSANRRAFLYVLSYQTGACELVSRTAPQTEFNDLPKAVSALIVQFATEHDGYFTAEYVSGVWRETVFGASGNTFVDDISYNAIANVATDLNGATTTNGSPCGSLQSLTQSSYAFGADEYMGFAR